MTATTTMMAARRQVAGDGLLNPVALAAIAVLILNDHLLKSAWPGFVTGKLSDFCGLLFFPLFLQGMVEVGQAVLGRWRGPSDRMLLIAVAVTGIVFASIKSVPIANEAAAGTLGLAQFVAGQAIGSVSVQQDVLIALDPRDLIALPMLAVAYLIGTRRSRVVAL
jgi:hypothetical protein